MMAVLDLIWGGGQFASQPIDATSRFRSLRSKIL